MGQQHPPRFRSAPMREILAICCSRAPVGRKDYMQDSGSTTVTTSRPAATEPWRLAEPYMARPYVVAVVVAGALALVVTAVFSMAEIASRVSSQAAKLHALDVVAVEVERTRHQLAVVAVLDTSGEDFAGDLRVADTSLSALEAVASREADLVGATLDRFLEAGRRLATSLESGEASQDLKDDLDVFSDAHEAVSEELTEQRATTQDQIDGTNRLLSRFGALGGGLVAFVVPLVGLYVYRRVGRRRLATYEFDADVRWRLATSEMATVEAASRIDEIAESETDLPESAAERLRNVALWLRQSHGLTTVEAKPTDVFELFSNRPEFPGLRRRVEGPSGSVCEVDPLALSAAFFSVEWAASRAGADELLLSTAEAENSWQRFDISGLGAVDSRGLAEVAGALESVTTALASIGVPVDTDETAMRWTVELPLAEPISS